MGILLSFALFIFLRAQVLEPWRGHPLLGGCYRLHLLARLLSLAAMLDFLCSSVRFLDLIDIPVTLSLKLRVDDTAFVFILLCRLPSAAEQRRHKIELWVRGLLIYQGRRVVKALTAQQKLEVVIRHVRHILLLVLHNGDVELGEAVVVAAL